MRKNRIAKAIKEYNGKHWKPNEAAFYPEDIREILETQGMTEKRKEPIADALQDALKAGFMIGYRKGKKEQNRKEKEQAAGACDILPESGEGASIEQAENFIYLFDAFIELLTAGEVNPKRYEQVVMNRYNCDMKSGFYFLAMGFCGALEALAHIENRIDQEEQAEDMVIL